ncbi:hypothetical protein KEM52_001760 [Ascosphaera acerosa]|nr:hypothetical protein KEM52_001760 [Ascosphaera acerosa]
MSSHNSLEAAAADRKARLARLSALKRKQAEQRGGLDTTYTAVQGEGQGAGAGADAGGQVEETTTTTTTRAETGAPDGAQADDPAASALRKQYLSGRNYDFETENVKLGFEHDPRAQAGQATLEARAAALARDAAERAAREKEDAAPLDLFQLQPKNPNWDLKRDLAEKMKVLDVRTDNAIARLVRERIVAQQKGRRGSVEGDGAGAAPALRDGQAVDLQGIALVEGVHQREAEGGGDAEVDGEI